MSFSTKECAWAQTSIKILSATMVGIDSFSFGKTIEKEALMGAGDDPIDITSGNKMYKVEFGLFKYEVDKMNDAALVAGYEDITEVPYTAIVATCAYKLTPTSQQRTITAIGVAFTDLTVAMKQNDKNTKVTLPAIAMKITHK